MTDPFIFLYIHYMNLLDFTTCAGTFVFAVTGAFKARASKMDISYHKFLGHQSPYLLPNKKPTKISCVPLLTVFNCDVVIS